jgi:hypothetical protein
MSMLDDMKGKMGDMSDEMKERLHMLKNKEKEGTISDSERSELSRLDGMRGHDSSSGQ